MPWLLRMWAGDTHPRKALPGLRCSVADGQEACPSAAQRDTLRAGG